MQDRLEKQRTYALIGHGGTGKTSLAELMLVASGTLSRQGKIEEGTTALDYEPEEIKRRGSIQPGFAHFTWKGADHFLVDTPGDTNFIGDLPYLLTAVDGVVLVVDALDGVKPLTKKIWGEARKLNLPALVFVNKMDRERADFAMAMGGLSSVLGVRAVPLFLPIGSEADFRGVVDVLGDSAWFFGEDGTLTAGPVPAEMQDEVQAAREVAVENIAETSEELMERYLDAGELSAEDLEAGLRQGVQEQSLVPVVPGAALAAKGGALLLDAIARFLPSPLARAPWQGKDGATRASSPEEPLAAFVCKTLSDPFTGQLSILRVLSGVLTPDMQVMNATKEDKEKIGGLLYLEGKKQ
ncbi:MAG: elongation factor, partial [Desulfomicrobiaceae bacterium]|nr:elongation factor [Desulfomicrobiaceae bacterium]